MNWFVRFIDGPFPYMICGALWLLIAVALVSCGHPPKQKPPPSFTYVLVDDVAVPIETDPLKAKHHGRAH
jgi:hypothetical protein